ncbi:hypothetical protein C3941_12730 [Kaistia algarum]|nr:hypothetical protein C3941_12730 [Kaistia algarum]
MERTVLEALAVGLRSILSPRRTIAAWPTGWTFLLTLAIAGVVLDLIPVVLAEAKAGYLAVVIDAYGLWIVPLGLAIIIVGLTALTFAIAAYFAAFNWAALRIVSRSIGFRSTFTAALLTAFIASVLAFVPTAVLAVASLPAEFPLQKSLDAVEGFARLVSALYLIAMQSVLADIGVGITLVLGLVSGVIAFVVGLAIAWGFGQLFPDADRLFSWIP